MNSNERQAAFLRELSELSKKYGIVVDGCGCCGSPFIYEAEEAEAIQELEYTVDKEGNYLGMTK